MAEQFLVATKHTQKNILFGKKMFGITKGKLMIVDAETMDHLEESGQLYGQGDQCPYCPGNATTFKSANDAIKHLRDTHPQASEGLKLEEFKPRPAGIALEIPSENNEGTDKKVEKPAKGAKKKIDDMTPEEINAKYNKKNLPDVAESLAKGECIHCGYMPATENKQRFVMGLGKHVEFCDKKDK